MHVKDEKEVRVPDASTLHTIRSIYCALDMLHDDVCAPHDRLPKVVGMVMMTAKEDSGIKEEVEKFVEAMIVLSEEFRGMTVNLMRKLSQVSGMPFENDVPVADALDSRKSYANRMAQSDVVENDDVVQLLGVLRTIIEKATERKGGGQQ
jgi:glycine cleavage system protein P-like pyridoxal-binding family